MESKSVKLDSLSLADRECEARTGGDRTEELAAQTWNCRVEKKEEERTT